MSSNSRIQLENWLKTIDVKGKVLDVGGSQNPIKGRTKSWEVEDYKILDLENPHEIKQKPDIIMDLQEGDLYGSLSYRKYLHKFDVAFCIEVSEYWYRPYNALRNLSYFLNRNGVLYISFHFIYPIHKPIDMDYLRYTPNGTIKLLEGTGFKVEDIKIREFTNVIEIGNVYITERMRGLKEYDIIQGCMIKARKI